MSFHCAEAVGQQGHSPLPNSSSFFEPFCKMGITAALWVACTKTIPTLIHEHSRPSSKWMDESIKQMVNKSIMEKTSKMALRMFFLNGTKFGLCFYLERLYEEAGYRSRFRHYITGLATGIITTFFISVGSLCSEFVGRVSI